MHLQLTLLPRHSEKGFFVYLNVFTPTNYTKIYNPKKLELIKLLILFCCCLL